LLELKAWAEYFYYSMDAEKAQGLPQYSAKFAGRTAQMDWYAHT
jgi:hypothetical protein